MGRSAKLRGSLNSHPVNLQTPVNDAAPPFVWRAFPARSRPQSAIAGAMLIAAICAMIWSFAGIAWAVGSALLLVLALNRFFFPSRFSIDEEGITATYLMTSQRLAWKNVRRFVHDAHGGYVSTRARRSRLDAYRGMHILFSDDRESIIRRIKDAMASARHDEDQPDEISGERA